MTDCAIKVTKKMPPVAATAASDTHKSTSASESSPSKGATKLCHIVKRVDFDGYGFNLHSEKSKPGQYIGKIDANSPAEAAGLKEGDRILEVNGLPIGNETHKQVVQRIKAIAWEVKLLVTRETTTNTNKSTASITTTNNNNSAKENKVNNEQKTKASSNVTTTTTSTPANNGTLNSTVSAVKMSNSSFNKTSSVKDMENTASPTIPKTPPPPLTPPSASKVIGNSTAGSLTAQKPDGTLKLPSTAAEMRAILQSKKKVNPKNDDVNLQKKYDIIQKL